VIDAASAHLLDDPVWAALTRENRMLGQGGPLARRYLPEIAPFGAVAVRSVPAFDALATLVPRDGRVALATVDPLDPPGSLVVNSQAPVIQMILNAPIATMQGVPEHVVLGAADMADMLDLTGRTRPGPFGPRTTEFGLYIGLRVQGALAAMSGERMRFDRFVEVSAVCVDPKHRGKGFAALLVTRLDQRLQSQGMMPFLHVFANNASAIALYEKLGFTRRRTLHMTVLAHPISSTLRDHP
jgi:ribosomal protein S18 acetylase RimI-like enzyme